MASSHWKIAISKTLAQVRGRRFWARFSDFIYEEDDCLDQETELKLVRKLFDFLLLNWSLASSSCKRYDILERAIQKKIMDFRRDGVDLCRYQGLFGFADLSCKVPVGKRFCKRKADEGNLCSRHRAKEYRLEKVNARVREQVSVFMDIPGPDQLIIQYLAI